MLYSIDCTARINAQDPDYPTYKKVGCTFHTNANDDNIYGKLINCTFAITTLIVTAAKNWSQGINIRVTIDSEDVSSALYGPVILSHDKNKVSTFSLNLRNTVYRPISDLHIDLDKVVVITTYINGQTKKVFTGLVDKINVENTPFNIAISGFGYGKKLLDKRTTIVTVQTLANAAYGSANRNNLIKYLAAQVNITDVDIPEMAAVTIDNSFSDQSVWEMVQKEAMVELYWVRFDEDATMILGLDDIKTDTVIYPTADWTYGENRFKKLNYLKSKESIINKIIVLGKTTQKRVPHTTTQMTNPGVDYTTPVVLFSDSLSFTDGELIEYNANNNYTKTIGDFVLKIHSYGYSAGGGNIHIYVGCSSQNTWESYVVTSKTGTIGGNATLRSTVDSISAGGSVGLNGILWVITRDGTGTNFENGQEGKDFTFDITVNGYLNREAIPETYETTTTHTVRYDQISVSVTDPNSIEKYGEKDGGSIEYPLLETLAQCTAVGGKYIQDSHRNIVNTSFRVPFNPLIIAGQTIQFRDSKIGLTTERYYIDGLRHTINPSGNCNTEVRCVYYA